MAILPIVQYPDPRLREMCQPVVSVTEQLRLKLSDMAETMYAAPGIGLAASQVGFTERILVIDIGSRGEKEGEEEEEVPGRLFKIVNPEVIKSSGSIDWEEGCLSIPGVYETVKRSSEISVKYLNENGEESVVEASGLLAVCLQHEIDHLNGVLFIDHLSRVRREMVKRKLAKLQQEFRER